MPRETLTEKATRLLVDHRLHITRIDHTTVRATIHGDHGDYQLGYDTGSWWCNCPAHGDCAHLHALQRVATPCPASRASRPIRLAA